MSVPSCLSSVSNSKNYISDSARSEALRQAMSNASTSEPSRNGFLGNKSFTASPHSPAARVVHYLRKIICWFREQVVKAIHFIMGHAPIPRTSAAKTKSENNIATDKHKASIPTELATQRTLVAYKTKDVEQSITHFLHTVSDPARSLEDWTDAAKQIKAATTPTTHYAKTDVNFSLESANFKLIFKHCLRECLEASQWRTLIRVLPAFGAYHAGISDLIAFTQDRVREVVQEDKINFPCIEASANEALAREAALVAELALINKSQSEQNAMAANTALVSKKLGQPATHTASQEIAAAPKKKNKRSIQRVQKRGSEAVLHIWRSLRKQSASKIHWFEKRCIEFAENPAHQYEYQTI